ncbi:ABC transporter permease [Oceaniserpentilla sp. 4NH20-0058]|uniref:ABC transporter permease n=1 Tax=Oceaniserpentilla sp. 4NH20-0058 TaxID=3127660 RepID=UPI003104118F
MARSSLKIMRDTVHALIMREINTRFGSSKLGYFWALAEPAAQAAVLAILFSIIGRSSLSGVPVVVFMMVGLVPFKFFTKLITQLADSVDANKALLSYRQVGPLDPFCARLIIEVVTFILVFLILMVILAWFGYDVMPQDLLGLLYASLLLVYLSVGLGLVLCTITSIWEDFEKVLQMMMRPLIFVSGVFFAATMIPAQYWYVVTWNPVFHLIEMMREAMFVTYTSPVADPTYVIIVSFVINALGLMMFSVNKQRFLTT